MGVDSLPETRGGVCRLIVRKKPDPGEILQYVIGGIEIGQQIVVLATPTWLKDLARILGESGVRPETLIRNGRLVFMTAPNCLSRFTKLDDPMQRPPLRRNGCIVRWISDWSWAYGNGTDQATALSYQRRIHECIHGIAALSVCTVHCENVERSSMLAMLLHHRRSIRDHERPV